MNTNIVLLAGNMTADIEVKFMPNGNAVGQFNLAVNRKYKTQEGELKEEVSFIKITTFGKTAENIQQFCAKGSPIFVEGRLKQERWETSDGSKRDRTVVVADRVQFLGKKKEETLDNEEN